MWAGCLPEGNREVTAAQATCRHHYAIDPPSGPLLSGQCRKCSKKRTWPADVEEARTKAYNGRVRLQIAAERKETEDE